MRSEVFTESNLKNLGKKIHQDIVQKCSALLQQIGPAFPLIKSKRQTLAKLTLGSEAVVIADRAYMKPAMINHLH